MFKYAFLLGLFFGLGQGLKAQILQPAAWSHSASTKEVKIGDEIDLIFRATIDPDWYLYSSDFDPDLGPMVTEFEFLAHPSYELIDGIKPIGAQEGYDKVFKGEYTYFKNIGEFRQKIRVASWPLKIEGSYSYQVCSDVSGLCIPGDGEFTFDQFSQLGSVNISEETNTEVQPKAEPVKAKETDEKTVALKPLEHDKSALQVSPENVEEANDDPGALNQPEDNQAYSLWWFMVVAFLGGLTALMTPCVYPLIPMTVAFFSQDRNPFPKALFYGFSIVVIYTIIGVAVSAIFGAQALNEIATSATANVIFFFVFLVFALSFFGLFEITLPSKFVNDIDKQADKGGYIGVFFMALTLAVVSFSCTAPIAGTILVESAKGEVIRPALGMLAYSLAFAIPFSLFAIFPKWLNELPKSGGWLNSVKVVLGFLELAFALKFLSVADQVYHWGILDREIYLALWIVIFALLGFYLLGKIRLSQDDILEKIGIPRFMLALATFAFVVYLIPGLFGAPLKSLAGFLPPLTTHDFNLAYQTTGEDKLCDTPKYADLLHLPHGLQGYFDLDQALACAKKQGKPVFIDFTGHGCVNCREMEAVVWSDPGVLRRLHEDYILVALYVDEKLKLPEDQWYVSSYDQKVKKSIGRQNADKQISLYDNNAQPFYVLLDPSHPEIPLVPPTAYNKSVMEFIEFLDKGKQRFEKQQPLANLNR